MRARKSELLAGELDGAMVVAKRLAKPNPVWQWYLAREIAIYRAFAADPPPLRVPRFVAADDDVLVIERLPGGPLAKLRRPQAELPAETVAALVAMHDALAGWAGRFPDTVPPPRVRSQLRARLLEDPTAPVGWVREGLARCGERAFLDANTARRAIAALDDHCPIAPSHGDLLLRNVVAEPGHTLGLVDWECGGAHVADWDLALLWTQLAGPGRAIVERAIVESAIVERANGDGSRLRTFWALVAFALAREVSFLVTYRVPPQHEGMVGLRAELAAVGARLA